MRLYLIVLGIFSILLSSCGESSSSGSDIEQSSTISSGSSTQNLSSEKQFEFEKLETGNNCRPDQYGEMEFSKGKNEIKYCWDFIQSWVVFDVEEAMRLSGNTESYNGKIEKFHFDPDEGLTFPQGYNDSYTDPEWWYLSKINELKNFKSFINTEIVKDLSDEIKCESRNDSLLFFDQGSRELFYCENEKPVIFKILPKEHKDIQTEDHCQFMGLSDRNNVIRCVNSDGVDKLILVHKNRGFPYEKYSSFVNLFFGDREPEKSFGNSANGFLNVSNYTYFEKDYAWDLQKFGFKVEVETMQGGKVIGLDDYLSGFVRIPYGEVTELTARAISGYCFEKWESSGSHKTEGDKIYLDSPSAGESVKAFFTDKCSFEITVTGSDGVDLWPGKDRTVSRGESATITWELNPGFINDYVEVNGEKMTGKSSVELENIFEDVKIHIVAKLGNSSVLLSDFSKAGNSFSGKASDAGGPATGYWTPYTDEEHGGNTPLLVEYSGENYGIGLELLDMFCPLTSGKCSANWNLPFTIKNGALNGLSKVTKWIPGTENEWGRAFSGWAYVFNTSNPTRMYALFTAKSAGLTKNDFFTIEYKYPVGERLQVILYDPDNTDYKEEIPRPRTYLKGTGQWENKIIRVSEFDLEWADSEPQLEPYRTENVISKVTALGILRNEMAGSKGDGIYDYEGEINIEIRKLCLGSCPE